MNSWTKIEDGLYRITSELGPRYVHQYLLVGEYATILVDAGLPETPQKVILPALKEIGIPLEQVTYLVVSHADVDHFCGVHFLRQANANLKVVAHQKDVGWIESKDAILSEHYFYIEPIYGPGYDQATKEWFLANLESCRVDIALSSDITFCIGAGRYIDIIHLPGHTPGHVALFDRKYKAAIVIDAVLGAGLLNRNGQIISPPPYYSLEDYLASLKRVKELSPKWLLTGHFDIMNRPEGDAFIDNSESFTKLMEAELLATLQGAKVPLNLQTLLNIMNEKVGPFSDFAVELAGPIVAHLTKMETDQIVTRTSVDGLPAWSMELTKSL